MRELWAGIWRRFGWLDGAIVAAVRGAGGGITRRRLRQRFWRKCGPEEFERHIKALAVTGKLREVDRGKQRWVFVAETEGGGVLLRGTPPHGEQSKMGRFLR